VVRIHSGIFLPQPRLIHCNLVSIDAERHVTRRVFGSYAQDATERFRRPHGPNQCNLMKTAVGSSRAVWHHFRHHAVPIWAPFLSPPWSLGPRRFQSDFVFPFTRLNRGWQWSDSCRLIVQTNVRGHARRQPDIAVPRERWRHLRRQACPLQAGAGGHVSVQVEVRGETVTVAVVQEI
jgi:hypothetical protein